MSVVNLLAGCASVCAANGLPKRKITSIEGLTASSRSTCRVSAKLAGQRRNRVFRVGCRN